MKKLLIAMSFLASVALANAQQALFGGQQVVSPEINADKSVTFRLNAPNATLVQVTGYFLPPQTIETPMGKWDAPGTADLK